MKSSALLLFFLFSTAMGHSQSSVSSTELIDFCRELLTVENYNPAKYRVISQKLTGGSYKIAGIITSIKSIDEINYLRMEHSSGWPAESNVDLYIHFSAPERIMDFKTGDKVLVSATLREVEKGYEIFGIRFDSEHYSFHFISPKIMATNNEIDSAAYLKYSVGIGQGDESTKSMHKLDQFWGSEFDGQAIQDGVQNQEWNDVGIPPLVNRKMIVEPLIEDPSNKAGTIAVNVKVDPNGKVIDAKYTTSRSTTTDAYLINLAEKAAMTAIFESDLSAPPIQLATILIVFRVN